MNKFSRFIFRKAAALVALSIIVGFYFLARQPQLSVAERSSLSSYFRFSDPIPLPDEDANLSRNVRNVAPNMQRISAWVSSTGAAIALNDLNGDGISNEFCKVDPRTDNVLIGPVPIPNTKQRFNPFVLDAGNLFDQQTMAPMGCIPNDYNEDGLTDILVIYWGRTPIVFLSKEQKKTGGQIELNSESYIAREIVPGGERWFTGAATVADIDGDGHLDIAVGNYYKDHAEVLDASSKTPQTMQLSMTRAHNSGRSRILRWTGASSGENPSVSYQAVEDYVEGSPQEKHELTHGWTLAIGACDLNGDLLPELYFANDFSEDRLLFNKSKPGEIRFEPLIGKKGFTTPNSKIVGRDGFKGMGVDFADLNGDNLYDFYVSNIAAEYALQESHFLFLSTGDTEQMTKGIAPYVDRSETFGVSRSNWAWDVKFGDFNNDGHSEILQATGFTKGETSRWAELHETAMGNDQLLDNPQMWHKFQPGDDLSGNTHNPFFVLASDGRFYDVAEELGLNRRQITRGIATADVNYDGKLDFAIANQWETSFFYLNEAKNPGNYLGLRLRLPLENNVKTQVLSLPSFDVSTRPAIGAQVSLLLPNGKRMISFVDGGNGHSGKRSPDVQFGLGDLKPGAEIQVEIRWRDSNGILKSKNLAMRDGWHTVLLGDD